MKLMRVYDYGGGATATRPLSRHRGVKKLYGRPNIPTVGPRPKVWIRDGRSRAKNDAPERLRCWTVRKMSSIRQLMNSFVLSDIGKRTKNCVRCNEDMTVHSEQYGDSSKDNGNWQGKDL